jgi:glycine/D-amino acid oxidase-like deaminating enzyme
MNTFDWIIVGGGITGSALAYELAAQGLRVLMLERHAELQGGTRFGYGGIAYWAATCDITRTLCAEGIALHRILSQRLEGETQFRELDLVMPIFPHEDAIAIAQFHKTFAIVPQLLSVEQACDIEPLLNPAAIRAALTVKHGHVSVIATCHAYTQAFLRLGGVKHIADVTALHWENERVAGVMCGQQIYLADRVAIAAGGLSRDFLKKQGIAVRQYFTHSEQLETPPVDITFRTIIMPANVSRFQMEEDATTAELDPLWDQPGHEPAPPILDAGGVQHLDGHIKIGQTSRTLTDPFFQFDPIASETTLRQQVGHLLPALQDLPAQYYHCLVAFTHDRLPLVGEIGDQTHLHMFSGFSNPLALVPATAQRFAKTAVGQPDPLIQQFSPNRWMS